MSDFKRITKGGSRDDKGGGRYLCTAVLLAFMLTAGLFLSACGGGGSTTDPTPGPGNGGGEGPAVTVSFGAATYSVTEGESETVTVTLSADPERTVAIPVMVDNMSTAAAADYSSLPASVTFASGETSKDITVAALEDSTDDDGETVILNFGTLPDGVTAGTASSTTVTINDAPDPCADAVAVTGTAEYDVKTADNGGDSDPDGEGVSICGDEAANIIRGGSGGDTIRGGEGNDELQGREGDDELHGGPGADIVVYRGTEGELDISLEDGTATDGYGDTDTLSGIENVRCAFFGGTTADTRIVGDSGPNIITGCRNPDGEDLIIGRGGDDTFTATSGDDYYDGGEGSDTLDYSRFSSAIVIDLGLAEAGDVTHSGDDTGKYGKIRGGSRPVYAKLEAGSSSETAGEGEVTIENLIGGDGADTLTGDADDNTLEGGPGADTLTGKGGADTLIGGTGADTLAGGPGDDTYHAEVSDTAVTEAADGGSDTLYYTGTTGIAHGVSYQDREDGTSPPNVETIYGTEHDDIIRVPAGIVSGATGGVKVIGGAGADTLIGGTGADTLVGCGGEDQLYSNLGESSFPIPPYAAPGESGDSQTNIFVIVSGDDADDAIRDFTANDQLLFAGFPAGTGRDDVAVDDELTAGETPDRIGNDNPLDAVVSTYWVKVSVNDEVVAFVRAADITDIGFDAAALETLLEDSTNQNIVFDQSYDTGCP